MVDFMTAAGGAVGGSVGVVVLAAVFGGERLRTRAQHVLSVIFARKPASK